MKTSKIISFFIICSLIVFLTNCGVKKMVKKQNDITYQVVPTTPESRGGKTTIQIQSTFPEKYFNKKASLSTIPALKNIAGDTLPLTPMDFQGEKADSKGQIVNYKTGGTYSSIQSIPYDPAFGKSVLVLNSTAKKNKKEAAFNERELGELTIDTKREDIDPKTIYKTSSTTENEPNYYFANHNYIPNKPIEKSAFIYFELNRDNLNWQVPLNKIDENKQNLSALFPFIFEYDSIQSVVIDGWASPEGELKRNEQLSSNRSQTGKKWFENEYNKYIREKSKKEKTDINTLKRNISYSLKDNGEDWDGFIEAVKNSSIKEKSQIVNVIQSQSNIGQREQQIRNMIAIYDEIDNNILPSLRRARIKVICLENLKTDEQIAKLAITAPDSLTNDELLYAASLTEDIQTKNEIFDNAIKLYPEDFRAYNDLACIKVSKGKKEEAKTLLEKSNALNPNSDVVLNNLGILSYQNKDYEAAEKYFNASQDAGLDQKKNLFLVKDTILVTSMKTYPTDETTKKPGKKDDGEITMAVKLNALIVTGVLNPAFEYKLSKHFSLQFAPVGTYWPNGFLGTKKPISLLMGFLEAKYYPKEVFKGFFVGVHAGFGMYYMARAIIPNHWAEPYNNIMHKGWNFMTGLTLGWTFPIKEHWAIEPFINPGFTYAKYTNFVNDLAVSGERSQNGFMFANTGGVYIIYKF